MFSPWRGYGSSKLVARFCKAMVGASCWTGYGGSNLVGCSCKAMVGASLWSGYGGSKLLGISCRAMVGASLWSGYGGSKLVGSSCKAMVEASLWAVLAGAVLSSPSLPPAFSQLGAHFFQAPSFLHSFRLMSLCPQHPTRFHTCRGCESEASSSVSDSSSKLAEADQFETEESDEETDRLAVPKGQLQTGLYLVATPIGNLEDITLRALRVLKSADMILTEDTRHSAKLLQHYGIHTPTVSYHKFNETRRIKFAVERLQRGGALAVISDAGMPGISDPGAELVMACVDAKISVFPIPGPSAVITALVGAGLRTTEFSFVGFLSAQDSHRRTRLMAASSETATQVFYVPPHKLCRVLEDCKVTFGSSRRCVVAREMTKIHEEFWRGTLEEANAEFSSRNPRGEITLVIEGIQKADIKDPTDEEIQSELEAALADGVSVSEAAKLVAQKICAKKKKVYDLALKLSRKHKERDVCKSIDTC